MLVVTVLKGVEFRGDDVLKVYLRKPGAAALMAVLIFGVSAPNYDGPRTRSVQAGYELAASCIARENPTEIADRFISRCRIASIRREFPTQHLHETLREIDRGVTPSKRKAWKLLNDKRFER